MLPLQAGTSLWCTRYPKQNWECYSLPQSSQWTGSLETALQGSYTSQIFVLVFQMKGCWKFQHAPNFISIIAALGTSVPSHKPITLVNMLVSSCKLKDCRYRKANNSTILWSPPSFKWWIEVQVITRQSLLSKPLLSLLEVFVKQES